MYMLKHCCLKINTVKHKKIRVLLDRTIGHNSFLVGVKGLAVYQVSSRLYVQWFMKFPDQCVSEWFTHFLYGDVCTVFIRVKL